MEELASLGKIGIPGENLHAQIGYVFLPSGVDRDKYVARCLATNTVSIITDMCECHHRVMVDEDSMQQIEFPIDSKHIGSPLILLNIPLHEIPVVVGVLKDNAALGKTAVENSFRIVRKDGNTFVDISGFGKGGQLNITSQTENEGDESNLNFYNVAKKGKLNISVEGEIDIEVINKFRVKTRSIFEIEVSDLSKNNKKTIINYTRETGFSYSDEFGNSLTTTKDGFSISNNNQSLKELFSSMFDLLNNFVVQGASGAASTSPNTQASIKQLKQKFEQLIV